MHVGTFCNEGSFTLPLKQKLNVGSIESDGTNQLTMILYHDTSLSTLLTDYKVFGHRHQGSISSFINPCHTCQNVSRRCEQTFSIFNMFTQKNMQFFQSYKDNADPLAICKYNVLTLFMLGENTAEYIGGKTNYSQAMLPELLWYKIQVDPINGHCANISSEMKSKVIVSYCVPQLICYSLVLHCGDVLHSRSTHIKLAIYPGYDWHYVIIQAWWVAKVFPVCKSLVSDVHEPVSHLHDFPSHSNTSECYVVPAGARLLT